MINKEIINFYILKIYWECANCKCIYNITSNIKFRYFNNNIYICENCKNVPIMSLLFANINVPIINNFI
jgi:hypothetical protein